MNFDKADRLKKFPVYLFKEIDLLRDKAINEGVDVIDLGIGDPDQSTPKYIVEALQKAVTNISTHRYPAYSGMNLFRKEVAIWFKKRFEVSLDSSKEVITLIGSKEGLAHFPLAYINPDDIILCPSPAYPVYQSSTIIAGGIPYDVPLLKKNDFLMDLESIPSSILNKAKILIINYPNNPTGATADLEYYNKVVTFAKKNNLIVVSDAAYTELYFDRIKPPSFLNAYGAMDVGIEFHSLSKTYNMTGWRLGFAVGNSQLISGLGQLKSQIDSGVFNAVQLAGIAALKGNENYIQELQKKYQDRRDLLIKGLSSLGLNTKKTSATFYVWCECPPGFNSTDFTKLIINKCGIIATPGSGFGVHGEGYIRFALTVTKKRLAEAVQRLTKLKL